MTSASSTLILQSASIPSCPLDSLHGASPAFMPQGNFSAADGFAVYSHLIEGTYDADNAGFLRDAPTSAQTVVIDSCQDASISQAVPLVCDAEPINSAVALPSVSAQILSTAQIERYCRKSIKSSSKKSFFPVYFALEASVRYGNEWFSGTQLLHALGKESGAYFGEWIRDPLIELGIADVKLDGGVFYVRLKDELMDTNHHHGKRALLIRQELNAYYPGKGRETPIAALLLIAIHVHSIFSARDLHQFLTPEIWETNKCGKTSATLRILERLCKAGRLQGMRASSQGRPLTVYPISEGAHD